MRCLFITPITRKSKKSRMGKGRGKVIGYTGTLYAGCFFIETRHMDYTRTHYFNQLLQHKLSAKTQEVFSQQAQIQGIPAKLSTRVDLLQEEPVDQEYERWGR